MHSKKPDVLPNITSLSLLKSLYQELSAPFQNYYKTILVVSWRDGSPDTEEIVIHGKDGVSPKLLERSYYHGAKSVKIDRTFIEQTAGSLYVPVSALGYRSLDYPWALSFKIDCDIARAKTGSTEDAMVHYVGDVAADDKIIKRRIILKEKSLAGRPAKTNTQDLEERYLGRMKNLTVAERKEIKEFIKKNKKALNSSDDSFRHEGYEPKTQKYSVSISAGPDDLDDENFLSWLLEQSEGNKRNKRKQDLDERDR